MSRLGRALALVPSLLAFGQGLALAEEGKSAAAPKPDTNSEARVDGTDVSEMSDIEDASLEGLMNLDLEDRLGQTETVSRTNESVLRAPAALTTIDATQIRLSGATTVADVLRTVPGVAVIRNAPGNYVVSLRGTGGLASNNVVLLIDGIALNSPMDGAVSWDLLPLGVEDIERIEVVRGPVSPAYGANAYTGVINIVTRSSAAASPSYAARVRGGANTRGGEVAAASGRFLQLGKNTELKWFLTAGHDSTSRERAAALARRHDDSPGADRLGMTAVLTLRPETVSSFSLEFGQAWSRRSGMNHLTLDSLPQSTNLIFGRVLYERHDRAAFLSNMRFWAQAAAFRVNQQDEHSGFSYNGERAERGSVGSDLVLPLSGWLSAQLGGQGALERVEAPFVHPVVSGEARSSYGFYAGLKAELLNSLDFIATARGDLSPISASLEYSYRASAIYHTDSWGLRLTGASAFRAPSYLEAAGRFVDPASGFILLEGTDTIKAPRNTSVELGATFSPDSRFIVATTVYWSHLSNLMVEDFDSVVRRTFRNDPEKRTFFGAEVEATWRVSDSISVIPSFSALRWLKASDSIDTNVGVPDQNSRYLAGLRLQGLLADETWGYGLNASLASARSFNVRSGIPPLVLSTEIPTTARIGGTLEHKLFEAPGFWASLRVNASIPGDEAESPLPLAAPAGQSAILGFEIRRE